MNLATSGNLKPISVYQSDSFHFRCDLKPEPWECCQRLVTQAEHEEIKRLKVKKDFN